MRIEQKMQEIEDTISNVDWIDYLSAEDVNKTYKMFELVIQNMINDISPYKTSTEKTKTKCWL